MATEKRKVKLYYNPTSRYPLYLYDEEVGITKLPIQRKKNGEYVSDNGAFIFLPPALARSIYRIQTDKPVVVRRFSDENRKVFYEIEEVINKIELSKSQEREKLKVYETPDKFLKFVAESIIDIIRLSVWRIIRHKNEEIGEEVLQVPREEFLNWLHANAKRLFQISGKEVFKQISELKEIKLVLFDPQAGSGRILNFLPENAILTGFELREIQNPDPRYKVITGIDSTLAFDVMSEMGWLNRPYFPSISQSTTMNYNIGKLLTNGFWYLNPPYEGTRRIIRETLASIPTQTFVFGLLSHVDKNTVLDGINASKSSFIYDEISREMVGYEQPIPERYFFFAGYLTGGSSGYPASFWLKDLDPLDFAKRLFDYSIINEEKILESLVIQSQYYKEVEKLSKVKERILEITKGINAESEEEFLKKSLDPISIKSLAMLDHAVFPALHYYKNGVLVPFKEVAGNPELLKVYKERFLEIYEVVKEVSEKRAIPLALQENQEDKVRYTVAPLERMGAMKFKYFPTVLEITEELKEVALSFGVSEEILSRGKSVWLKNKFSSTTKTGEETFGYVPVLVVADEYGQTIEEIPVPLKEFFDKLVEKGVVKINAKDITEHPDYSSALSTLIRKVAKDLQGVFSEEEKEIIERMRKEGKSIRDIATTIYLQRRERREDFMQKLYKDNARETALLSAHAVLKARGREDLWDKVYGVLERLNGLFEKYPANFLNNLFEVRNESFTTEHTEGLPVKDYASLLLRRALPDEDELLIKDLASAYTSKIDLYRDLLNSSLFSVEKLLRAYLVADKLVQHLDRGEIKEAEELFRDLHLKVFKLLPHQYEEGLKVSIKAYLTGESGHLLGWEMRSGKTLAMTLAGYFASHLFDNKTFMFVRSANLFDITRQVFTFLPHVAQEMVVLPNTELAQKVFGDEVVSFALPGKAFPNIFSETSLFKGKGSTAKLLLEKGALGRIENYAKEEFDLNLIRGKPYERLLFLEGFDKELLKGLVRFIYENEERFELRPELWKKYTERLSVKAKTLKNTKDGRLFVISKETHLLGVNYRLERDRKVLGYSISANGDVEVRALNYAQASDLINQSLSDYVVISEEGLEYLKERVKDAEKLEEILSVMEPLGKIYGKGVGDAEINESIFILPSVFLENLKISFLETPIMRADVFYRGLLGLEEREAFGNALNKLVQRRVKNVMIESHFKSILPSHDAKRGEFILPEWKKGETVIRSNPLSQGKDKKFSVFYSLDGSPQVSDCLASNKRDIVYASGLFDGHNVVVDEIDQSSRMESETYKVIKSIKSPLKVASTGTITNGSVESVVELLGLISSIRYDSLEKLTEIVKELYGTYTISERYDFHKVLFKTFMNAKGDEEALEELLLALTKPNSDTRSFISKLMDIANSLGILSASDELTLLRYTYEAREEELRHISLFLTRLKKEIEERENLSELSYTEVVQEALFSAMKKSGAIKQGVGTLNPIGFMKVIDLDTSLSLYTREMLKGVEEELVVEDKEIYDRIKTWENTKIWSISPEGNTVGTLRPLEESYLSVEEILEEEEKKEEEEEEEEAIPLRKYYDRLNRISFEEGGNPINQARALFSTFMDLVEEVQKLLLNDPEYANLVGRSGTSTQDDLSSLIRNYLLNNQNWESLSVDEEEEVGEEIKEKREFAVKVLHALASGTYDRVYWQNGEKEMTFYFELDGKPYSLTVQDYSVKNYLESSVSENPFKEVLSTQFSILIDLSAGRNWDKKLFKEDPTYPYRLKFVWSREEEVIDAITNKGYVKAITEDLAQGRNLVLTPSRIHVLPIVVVDALNSAVSLEREKPLIFIVRRTSPEQEEYLRRLNTDYLKEKGITLKIVSTQAELDAELRRLKGYLSDVQAVVVAPAQSVARGVDFSMLDTLYVLGTLEGKGREFTQLLARLYNSTDKHTASIRLFGTPTRWLIVSKTSSTTMSPSPTQSALVQARLLDKAQFAKDLLKGDLTFIEEEKPRKEELKELKEEMEVRVNSI